MLTARFLENRKLDSWNEYINSPGYNAWRGNSFEIVCLNHIDKPAIAKKINAKAGDVINLYEKITGADDLKVSRWESSKPSVATVNSDGVVIVK